MNKDKFYFPTYPDGMEAEPVWIFEPSLVEDRINRLKTKLAESDYKVLKAYELSLLKLSCEYDMPVVHAERQAIRDEINELETLLNETVI